MKTLDKGDNHKGVSAKDTIMEFPKPTQQQARWLWHSLTALAVGVLVAMAVFLLWGAAWLASKLSAVLIPLAAGAILACLLDPLVVFLAR